MVRGLDHVVVAVQDLETAGRAYEALGFTLTHVNRHPWGTANRIVQLDGFFIEILSVADPGLITEAAPGAFSFGAFNRDFLKERQGASMLVLESQDPDADRAAFQKAGLTGYEPFAFERVATYLDGTTANVGFDLTFVSDRLAPSIGYFTCRNRFPENFWKADYQTHANGAQEIKTVYLVAADPSDHHEFLGGFTGQREMRATSLGLEMKTPRGTIMVLTPAAFASITGEEADRTGAGLMPHIAGLDIACHGLAERKVVPAHELFGMTLMLSPV
ncbi:VOC family protein [Roseibium denhamense]|uniref:Glyoxalase-like domain-containing protein n=1 Tax=Roseibium denhamense TaxID=76305 RepID=A0ABY1PFJ5_9HYPH|nr:VOC family protein [Roseibium denhamense]MTI06199.1 VOC family protein [Roseibium denhamense]SMP32497.1 Glyoxalase-like domain-containing protein [Roseibium denhamense]